MGPSDGWGAALLVGALAGLAVAVPVGPVGVLLLREGVVRGTRVAVGAALGVASVDAVYAVLAVVIGVPVGRAVEAHADVVRLTSAGVLLLVGAVGVVGAVGGLRAHAGGETCAGGAADAAAPDGGGGLVRPRATARRAYARFVALTAINPTTAVTFATVAVGAVAGLAGASAATVPADRPALGAGAAFVLGVSLASVAWQLVLACGAGLLGRRLGVRGRAALSVGGSLVVVALAGVLALG